MDEARLRAWKALDLGPLWVRRPAHGAEAGEGVAQTAVQAEAGAPAGEPPAEAFPRPPSFRNARTSQTPQASQTGRPPAAGAAASLVHAQQSPPGARPGDGATLPPSAGAPGIVGLDWSGLRTAVEECRACGLCETRTRTVFGAGPQDARWLVVGEAPGAEEDASGEPFVGQAGRLLDAMLASVGLDRGRNVFIANVLKCRPPGNRNPSPEELARCLPFLRRQIELLQPDLVLLLGRVAAHALLETDAAVGSLRGRVHALRAGAREIPAVVTWHPSYLLRRPEDKALAWSDLCLARAAFASEG